MRSALWSCILGAISGNADLQKIKILDLAVAISAFVFFLVFPFHELVMHLA